MRKILSGGGWFGLVGRVVSIVAVVGLCVVGRVARAQETDAPKADVNMAKNADPDWDVVTVKPSDPNDTDAPGFRYKAGRMFIKRKTVKQMLMFGYGVQAKELVGLPTGWATDDRWNVEGILDVPGQTNLLQLQSVVRKILVERFGLKTHKESREMTVYAITVAKGGPKLEKSKGNPDGPMSESDNEHGSERTIRMTDATMGEFASIMTLSTDQPMVDQTGIAGRYDFILKWTMDESKIPDDGTAAPGMFTAAQEELGLKMTPAKAPVDVLVVDNVERPSAN